MKKILKFTAVVLGVIALSTVFATITFVGIVIGK